MLRPTRLLLASFILALATARAEPTRPLRVVSLHSVLTEIARTVGGPAVEVTGLVAPGVDPHTFDPTPRDLATALDADLVLATGLRLEGYLERLAAQPGARGPLLRVGEALPVILSVTADDHAGHDHARELHTHAGEADPHWWHSIDNVLFATDLVRAEFTRLRPAAAADFAARAQAYQQRLFALKAWAAREVAQLAPARRHLVTTHDAFGYLARDWGFTVHAISGLSTENEPDPRHLADLVKLVRKLSLPAVFAEGSASPKLAQTLAAETGARIGGTLHADGLAPAGSGAETYEALMRHNLGTIIAALR
jgi:zinc/manganese transport system substrate-binding protein